MVTRDGPKPSPEVGTGALRLYAPSLRRRALKPVARLPESAVRLANTHEQRWFEEELARLWRLVHTERMCGNFVGAQRLERDIERFCAEVSALI